MNEPVKTPVLCAKTPCFVEDQSSLEPSPATPSLLSPPATPLLRLANNCTLVEVTTPPTPTISPTKSVKLLKVTTHIVTERDEIKHSPQTPYVARSVLQAPDYSLSQPLGDSNFRPLMQKENQFSVPLQTGFPQSGISMSSPHLNGHYGQEHKRNSTTSTRYSLLQKWKTDSTPSRQKRYSAQLGPAQRHVLGVTNENHLGTKPSIKKPGIKVPTTPKFKYIARNNSTYGTTTPLRSETQSSNSTLKIAEVSITATDKNTDKTANTQRGSDPVTKPTMTIDLTHTTSTKTTVLEPVSHVTDDSKTKAIRAESSPTDERLTATLEYLCSKVLEILKIDNGKPALAVSHMAFLLNVKTAAVQRTIEHLSTNGVIRSIRLLDQEYWLLV